MAPSSSITAVRTLNRGVQRWSHIAIASRFVIPNARQISTSTPSRSQQPSKPPKPQSNSFEMARLDKAQKIIDSKYREASLLDYMTLKLLRDIGKEMRKQGLGDIWKVVLRIAMVGSIILTSVEAWVLGWWPFNKREEKWKDLRDEIPSVG